MAEQNIQKVKSTSPKDVFLQLLAIITLYFSAGSFLTALFQYANVLFPDVLFSGSYNAVVAVRTPLRFAVSSLIVVFPVYIWLSWLLNKGYREDAGKRDSKLRKWLVYFTIFVTALVIIGDLVTLVYNFLGGEITARFILKALSVLLVAGLIFGYYLWDARRKSIGGSVNRSFAWIVSIGVGVTVVGAFFLIGSPVAERARLFDERRVGNLNDIQWQIINYWQRKEKLPVMLSDLEDPISGYHSPLDPETNLPYKYSVKGTLIFELCALFNGSSDSSSVSAPVIARPVGAPGGKEIPASQDSWAHGAGRVCFERTIDKDLYPPFLKIKP